MIFHGEISIRRNFGRNSKKSAISRDISAILEINLLFFPIYHMVNRVNDGQTRYSEINVLQSRYSA